MIGSRVQVITAEAQGFTGCHQPCASFMGFLTKLWDKTEQPLLSATGHHVLMLLVLKGAPALRRKAFSLSLFLIHMNTNTQAPGPR